MQGFSRMVNQLILGTVVQQDRDPVTHHLMSKNVKVNCPEFERMYNVDINDLSDTAFYRDLPFALPLCEHGCIDRGDPDFYAGKPLPIVANQYIPSIGDTVFLYFFENDISKPYYIPTAIFRATEQERTQTPASAADPFLKETQEQVSAVFTTLGSGSPSLVSQLWTDCAFGFLGFSGALEAYVTAENVYKRMSFMNNGAEIIGNPLPYTDTAVDETDPLVIRGCKYIRDSVVDIYFKLASSTSLLRYTVNIAAQTCHLLKGVVDILVTGSVKVMLYCGNGLGASKRYVNIRSMPAGARVDVMDLTAGPPASAKTLYSVDISGDEIRLTSYNALNAGEDNGHIILSRFGSPTASSQITLKADKIILDGAHINISHWPENWPGSPHAP